MYHIFNYKNIISNLINLSIYSLIIMSLKYEGHYFKQLSHIFYDILQN